MNDHDVFRQDLAGLLLREAASRLRIASPAGADIKAVALLERLASDMDHLDPSVFARCRPLIQASTHSRRIGDRAAALLPYVGVYCCPSTADDLVLWLADQLAGRPGVAPAPPSLDRGAGRTGPVGERRNLLLDVTSALAVVLPLASVWQVKTGLDVARDHAFVAEHIARAATVVSSAPIEAGRSGGAFSRTVVDFPLDVAGLLCRVAVTTTASMPFVAGDTIMVVPRGDICDEPLLPAQVGDPSTQFVLAGVLMAAGLAALKAWSVLVRRSSRAVAAKPLGRTTAPA